MTFQAPSIEQEGNNRKILHDLQEKRKRLQMQSGVSDLTASHQAAVFPPNFVTPSSNTTHPQQILLPNIISGHKTTHPSRTVTKSQNYVMVVTKGKHLESSHAVWSGSFQFIQATDPQLGLMDHFGTKKKDDEVVWTEETRLSELFVNKINAMSPLPKFVVVTGDLIDAMPGNKLRDAQVADFKRIFSKINVPLFCLCGNHDVGDHPSLDDIKLFRNTWGDDYYSFVVSGVLFIVLNSQFFADDTHVKQESSEQMRWFETQLVEAISNKYQHVIVFQHTPPFITSPDEDEQYFNLSKSFRKELISKLKKSSVRYLFCGHYHQNAGGRDGSLEVVVTSAIGCQLGSDPHGYRIVDVSENEIKHTYVPIED